MTEGLTSARLAEAFAAMRRAKDNGVWAGGGGDIPAGLGPQLIPDGWHTLDELFDVMMEVELAARPAEEGTEAGDDVMYRTLERLFSNLTNGHTRVHVIGDDGQAHRVPGMLWRRASNENGGTENIDRTIAYSRLTGSAFEPDYVGRTPLVRRSDLDAVRIMAQPDLVPWREFRSRTGWLRSEASTTFAHSLIAARGGWRRDEATVREALFAYLSESAEPMPWEAMVAARNKADKA